MTCRRPFQATATELRAESVGNVCAMDLQAADELDAYLQGNVLNLKLILEIAYLLLTRDVRSRILTG